MRVDYRPLPRPVIADTVVSVNMPALHAVGPHYVYTSPGLAGLGSPLSGPLLPDHGKSPRVHNSLLMTARARPASPGLRTMRLTSILHHSSSESYLSSRKTAQWFMRGRRR